jgi:organic radical activating enzyme
MTSNLIFGCGQTGKCILPLLKQKGYKIDAFIDNSVDLQGTEHEGIPIVSPSKYIGSDIHVIIAMMDRSYIKDAVSDLINLKINNFSLFTEHCYQGVFSEFNYWRLEITYQRIKRGVILSNENKSVNDTDSLTLDSIDFPITDRCTRRCRDCANLMQYFKDPKDANYFTLTQAFDRIYRLSDWIYEVRILGGEPLINPQLPDYIKHLSKYERISDICILTNGTILPTDKLLNAMTDNRITIWATEYEDTKQRLPEIINMFNNINVPVYTLKLSGWQDCAKLEYHERTPQQLKTLMEECCISGALPIKDGKLFGCPYAGSLYALSAVPTSTHEYVNLLSDESDESLKNQIVKLMKLQYLKVCSYCGGRPGNHWPLKIGIQADKPLDYIRYEE